MPLYGLFLVLVITDSAQQDLWCKFLITTREGVIIPLFMNIFFFHCVFRHALVLYADRGLEEKGRPNLRLFYQLYWLVSLTFVVLGTLMWPTLAIARGTIERSPSFKMCTKRAIAYNPDLHSKDSNSFSRGIMLHQVVPLIPIFVQVWAIISFSILGDMEMHN